ncbi:MAG TPA: antitoxin Xre/MbcA/ParS toxin-binding domain-containing protein [Roseiarcus sp.]|nr:antitoxin Xre/MbcA/ParS toxin-binding domain-containing protein [Roseiarcus sp.]
MKPKARLLTSKTQPEAGRGGGFVAAFRDSKGVVAVGRVAERFGLSKVQLAQTIGVERKAIYRTTRLEAPKTQARTTEMLEILGRIVDWAGGEMQAMAWYRAEPISAFGGRTAESLVKAGMAAAVRDYLDHVATGGFA